MEPVMGQSDIYSNSEAFEAYMEMLKIQTMNKGDFRHVNIVAHLITFIWLYQESELQSTQAYISRDICLES